MLTEKSFLGTGWTFPPAFTNSGAGVGMVSGPEDINESLAILLGTRIGERVMQERFGCNLDGFLFEEMDQGLVSGITSTVSDAILYFEPRITVENLDVGESDDEPGLLLIRIDYSIRGTNSRYNMVYPFYVNEGSVAP
uniref:IraD/Gp25-like domain-containing protein n=1 Tax=Candidatus Kentrum sp. DK TaxID=2126562 RepID=A0A450RV71_9GAMM|nr:MAG: hypothetical protein BECKDK2373B_GA0170837_100421 [Candidatus Kentron sp. DK]